MNQAGPTTFSAEQAIDSKSIFDQISRPNEMFIYDPLHW